MEGEGTGIEGLPDRFEEWIDRRASELGTDRAGVLTRAVMALRAIEDESDAPLVDQATGDRRRLEDRVSELESDVDAKIDDVRERVIQVKRETDAKADADHAHPDLRESAADTVSAAAEANRRAEDAADAAADVDDRVTAGFENFEEVLASLRDDANENGRKLDATARTILDLRERVTDLEAVAARLDAASARLDAASELRAEANRRGVTVARCESCDATVTIALLDGPVCPHCDVAFAGLGPDPGFFRNPVLTAGDPPALTAASEADLTETATDSFERDAADEGVDSEG